MQTRRTQSRGAAAKTAAAPAARAQATAKEAGGSWTNLGTLREREGKSYLVFYENVEIFKDGEKVDLGQFRTVKLVDPRPGLDTMLQNGSIDESEHETQLTDLDGKNVRYRLTVPPQS